MKETVIPILTRALFNAKIHLLQGSRTAHGKALVNEVCNMNIRVDIKRENYRDKEDR